MTLNDLSSRRREVAILIGDGLNYRDIAKRLANLRSFRGGTITPSTVKMHVNAIAEKLGDDGVPPKIRVMLWVRAQHRLVPRAS